MPDPVYIEIVKDSFLTHLAITVNEEFAYYFTLLHGKQDKMMATIFAMVGSSAGIMVTYGFFYLLAHLTRKLLDTNPGYPAARHYIKKTSPILAIAFSFPQFFVLPAFFFGITRMSALRCLVLVLIFRAFYYAYMLNITAAMAQ